MGKGTTLEYQRASMRRHFKRLDRIGEARPPFGWAQLQFQMAWNRLRRTVCERVSVDMWHDAQTARRRKAYWFARYYLAQARAWRLRQQAQS